MTDGVLVEQDIENDDQGMWDRRTMHCPNSCGWQEGMADRNLVVDNISTVIQYEDYSHTSDHTFGLYSDK